MTEALAVYLLSADRTDWSRPLTIAHGTTLQQFLGNFRITPSPKVAITVHRTLDHHGQAQERVSLTYVLREGDVISVVPRAIRAEWIPRVKEFKRYLAQRGFNYLCPGKGDHEVWVNGEGVKITLNPSRRNRSEIDKACLQRIADVLDVNYGQVKEEILESRKAKPIHAVARSEPAMHNKIARRNKAKSARGK